MQTLTPADFEGCGSKVHIDFVMRFTDLCVMISYIMRERFGLRVSQERRKAVLGEADRALANWSLILPDSLKMSTTDMDSWPALLHLTYNNFLILLHRPHPRASAYSDDYGPNDAEICSAAAGVIVSIFEDLRKMDRIKYLWISSVNALFTAMIQVRVELRFSNPVLAINGLRRFDSTMNSLRILSEHWINAETILRLFEGSKRLQHDMQMVKSRELDRKPTITREQSTNLQYQGQRSEQSGPVQYNTNWPVEIGLGNEDETSTQYSSMGDSLPQTGHVESASEAADWKQLFQFTDPDPISSILAENCTDLEDEWRELYLHDPWMTDYFGDCSWLQG